jgi:hypothetical protein
MKHSLELTEVIKALRKDLTIAADYAEGEEIRFNVDSIDVELQTVVEKEANIDIGGKIKFWVLDIDAKTSGKYAKATTHKIKLHLKPVKITVDKDGNETSNELQINDKA